jgi:hypothetical protein
MIEGQAIEVQVLEVQVLEVQVLEVQVLVGRIIVSLANEGLAAASHAVVVKFTRIARIDRNLRQKTTLP